MASPPAGSPRVRLSRTGRISLNVLSADQKDLAAVFFKPQQTIGGRFDAAPFQLGELGLPWGLSRPWSFGPLWPRSMRAWRTQRARLLDGRPRRWATALQERPSCRQSSTASAFCCAVNRRLVLVGEYIDGQSGGHGVTPIDLSLKSGEAQPEAGPL